MRFFKNSKNGGWLAALAIGALGITSAHAGGKGDKIQFSQPGSAAVTSNLTSTTSNPGLDRLNPAPTGLRQVQDDLFRPLKDSLPSVDSMQQGVMPPPAAPQARPQLSKHARELLDRRRNWAFTDLNDLTAEPTMEEAVGLNATAADGKDKAPVSIIQRYYERQNPTGQKRNQRPQQLGEINGTQKPDFTGATPLNPLLSPIPGIEPSSFGRNIFAPAQDSENVDKSANANFTGTGKYSQYSPAELAAQKHRDEFNHLLDPSLPATKPVGNSFIGAAPAVLYGRAALYGQNNQAAPAQAQAVAKPFRSAIYPLDITDPAAKHSSVFDDPTAVALGIPNPAPVKTTPAPITAEAVQKMLDPFTANMMKRKF